MQTKRTVSMKVPRVFNLIVLCFCNFYWGSNSLADDWPRFLGINANGFSQEGGIVSTFPEDGPSVVWRMDCGTGYSAPSIQGSTLYLFHRREDREIVEALDRSTGVSLWKHDYETSYRDPYGYNNGPRCTPLIENGRCYTFGAEGQLRCLNAETGELVWKRDTASDWNVPSAFFGVGSTPILNGELLFVMVGGQPESGMVAFDAATGNTVWESIGKSTWEGRPKLGWPGEPKVIWKGWEKQASYASPVLAEIHGKPHLLCLMRQGLVSLEPSSGAVRFRRWFQARVNESVNAANPIVHNNKIFFSAAYYRVGSVLLEVNPDSRGFEERWNDDVLEIHWTTPILHEGYLYAFSGRNEPDARFRCVEFETGKLMWDRDESWRKTTRTPDKYGRGSAIFADGKLIALGEGGLLGMFEPNPKKPVELARWQVPGLSYPCWTAPVLSDGKLYLRSENQLLCLDLSVP